MWRWAGARATGRSHLRSGLPCQDRFGLQLLPDGTLIAALADGAGSAMHGEVGAEVAVCTVLSGLHQALTAGRRDLKELLQEVASEARGAVATVAEREQTEIRQYASTLLAVVLRHDQGVAMQIGDGVMVVKRDHEDWSWIIWPQRGEYANTTFFLTDSPPLQRLDVQDFPGAITDLAMMSDGLECLALRYSDQSVYQPFLTSMVQSLLRETAKDEIKALSGLLEQFLVSEKVSSRTDDDVSIILATRRPPTPPS